MKVPFKIAIGLAIMFIIGVGHVFGDREYNNIAVVDVEAQEKFVSEKISMSSANDKTSPVVTEKEVRIQTLKDDVQEQYLKIVQLTGSSGKQNLSYEDNWCVAPEDLTEEDAVYASKQLKEWEFNRGNIIARGGELNALIKGLGLPNDEFPGINDEYLTPYKEADKDTLIHLGNQDDRLALTTIVQSKDYDEFDLETRLNAGRRLVVLGDTSFGLLQVIIHHMENAAHAERTGEGDPAVHLKSALALIEYGMIRQDASNLGVFLADAADYEERLSGVNPAEVLTEQDFADIEQMARNYYDDVNKRRINRGLPSFEEIDEPKIAQIHYAETLSSYYRDYATLLEGNTLPSSWKDTYLEKTPCVERRIAMHNFLTKQLPAIQDEIAMLEKSLN
jgi:hypothetical protein